MRRRRSISATPPTWSPAPYLRAAGLLWLFKLGIAFGLSLSLDAAIDHGPPSDWRAWLWTIGRATLIRVGPELLAEIQTVTRALEARAASLRPALGEVAERGPPTGGDVIGR